MRSASRISERGLDWFTFFVADIQTGFGPYLAVYLTTQKWNQADIGQLRLSTSLGNAELNYRLWNTGINNFELILGVRYLHVRDKLEIFTDDDGLSIRDAFNRPDLQRQADQHRERGLPPHRAVDVRRDAGAGEDGRHGGGKGARARTGDPVSG